jgi:hypothetical protein
VAKFEPDKISLHAIVVVKKSFRPCLTFNCWLESCKSRSMRALSYLPPGVVNCK